MQQFFFDESHDGDWYIVPEEKREEWDNWIEVYEGEAPDFAKGLSCHPRDTTFWMP